MFPVVATFPYIASVFTYWLIYREVARDGRRQEPAQEWKLRLASPLLVASLTVLAQLRNDSVTGDRSDSLVTVSGVGVLLVIILMAVLPSSTTELKEYANLGRLGGERWGVTKARVVLGIGCLYIAVCGAANIAVAK